MEQSTQHSSNTEARALRLGARHGYRIDGDFASLNAELSGTSAGTSAAEAWALQLWACDEPYAGGALSGIKVAEAPIELSRHAELSNTQLDAEAFAHIPAAQRDYSMVLVLASGTGGAFAQVHDFANYPARQRFVAPHLDGSVGFRVIDENHVAISSQQVVNPRPSDNLSGSLSLQLWALEQPYRGGPLTGHMLASAQLRRLAGQSSLSLDEQYLSLSAPPQGDYSVALVLCEWTAEGYLTRDFCSFSERYAGPTLAVESSASSAEPTEQAAAAQVALAPKPLATKPSEPSEVKPSALKSAKPEQAAKLEASKPPADTKPAKAVEPVAKAAEPEAKPVAKLAEPEAKPVAKAVEPDAKPAAAKPPSPSAQELVSLQTATLEQLCKLPGIDKKVAGAIIKARPFKSLDELSRVRGIGEKSLRSLRALLKL